MYPPIITRKDDGMEFVHLGGGQYRTIEGLKAGSISTAEFHLFLGDLFTHHHVLKHGLSPTDKLVTALEPGCGRGGAKAALNAFLDVMEADFDNRGLSAAGLISDYKAK